MYVCTSIYERHFTTASRHGFFVLVFVRVEKSEILVVLDEDAFSNIDKFHDGSENIDEDDVSDESVDVAEEDWTGLD